MSSMAFAATPSQLLTSLNILVAVLGVGLVILGFIEYRRVSSLRNEFNEFYKDWRGELSKAEKAMQRIIASYSLDDPDEKIRLIESALELDPEVFNGFNSLGYAYLQKGEYGDAIAAFQKAVYHNPEAVEGYCDLGLTYLKQGKTGRALKHFRKAKKIDSEALEGLRGVPEVDEIMDQI